MPFLLPDLLWPNISIDVLLFIASEIIIRMILSDVNTSYTSTSQHRFLFTIQMFLLLTIASIVYICHHVPVVLILCATIVFVRVIIMSCQSRTHIALAVSRQLKYANQKKFNDNTDRSDVAGTWMQFTPSTSYDGKQTKNKSGGLYPIHRPIYHGLTSAPPPVTPLQRDSSPTISPGFVTPKTTKSFLSSNPPIVTQSLLPKSTTTPSKPTKSLASFRSPHHSPTSPQRLPVNQSSVPSPFITRVQSTWSQVAIHNTGASSLSPTSYPASGVSSRNYSVMSPLITSSLNSPWKSGPPKPVPPGMHNSGNICFLNAILQCLARMTGFMELLTTFPDTDDDHYNTLVTSLISVINQCQNWNLSTVSTSEFLYVLAILAPHLVTNKAIGEYQSQQDAGEFLLWLLNRLHEIQLKVIQQQMTADTELTITQLERRKENILMRLETVDSNDIQSYRDLLVQVSQFDYHAFELKSMSSIYNLCCGQLMEARECQHCKKMSVNLEYYTLLPIPVPTGHSTSSLTDCFRLFSEVEDLTRANNMLRCSCTREQSDCPVITTGLTPGKRLSLLSHLPSQLIIQLSRFSYDVNRDRAIKNQSPVVFPASGLDLTSFTMEHKLNLPAPQSTYKPVYDLTGFCVHTGARSTNYGHYIAYCKVKDGSWYCFNDNYVSIVNNIQSEIKRPFVLQNTYILFYSAQSA